MSSGRTAPWSHGVIPAQETPDDGFRWRPAIVLFGILFLGVSDAGLIPPLLPSIAQDLETLPGRAGTIVTAYSLAAAIAALVLGPASDRIGRKRLMCAALLVFAAASIVTWQSLYFSTLFLARLMTGFSAGTLSTLAISYAGDHYRYEHRGKAMGIISMAYFLAFVVSIPAGALVASRISWRWVFLSLAAGGLVVALVTLATLPGDARRRAGARPSLGILPHFRSADRLSGIVIASLTSGGLVGFLTYVGVWLAEGGVTIERLGLLFMVAGVAATAAAPISGAAADRLGKKRMILGANLLLAPLFVVVSGLEWGVVLFLTVGLLSVTASARQAPLHALTTELVESGSRGSYIAVRNAASQLGIATAATASAFAYDRSGFGTVAWIAAIVTILILPASIWLTEPKR